MYHRTRAHNQHQVHLTIASFQPLIYALRPLLRNPFTEPHNSRAKKIIFALGAVRQVREWNLFDGDGLHSCTGLGRGRRLLFCQGGHSGCVPVLSLVAASIIHAADAEERPVEADDLIRGVTRPLAEFLHLVSTSRKYKEGSNGSFYPRHTIHVLIHRQGPWHHLRQPRQRKVRRIGLRLQHHFTPVLVELPHQTWIGLERPQRRQLLV